MGWKRTWLYYKKRIIRIHDNAYSIAAGLAFGAAISFTPLIGTHIIQTLLFCFLFRANALAGVIGTIIGNPITFPFLWSLSAAIGIGLFNLFGYGIFLDGFIFPTAFSEIADLPVKYLLPVVIGGYVAAFLSFPLFYYPFKSMIITAKRIRKAKIKRTIHKAAKDVTGQTK